MRSVLIAVMAASLAVCAGAANSGPAPDEAWSRQMIDLSEKWGVQILGIRTSAAGYMLDFRYRVTDAAKAAPIFKRGNKPVLVDERSKQEFQVASSPTVGPMRSSNAPLVGRTYFMLFGNPGGYIRPGGKVAVKVGPFHVEGLIVQ